MERLTVTAAAPLVSMSAAQLMAWIRDGKCPFGIHLIKEGNRRGEYIIFEKRMNVFIEGADMGTERSQTDE